MQILVVDDESAFCKILREFLVRLGHTVTIATNGEQAMAFLEDERPDLMMLDIRMPGMNGYKVLENLKREGKSLAVIVMTAMDTPDLEESLVHAGACAVLRKPVDLALLTKTIGEVEHSAGNKPTGR